MQTSSLPADISAIERPSPQLLKYYLLTSLVTGPLFPIVFLPQYFKYYTLRYRFDDEGISMRWGILFRREIVLNYARIQDIHLRSNIVERWLGLAKIEIQTAAGSTNAEMAIEGLIEFEAIRDFVYARMRGTKDAAGARHASDPSRTAQMSGDYAELVKTLQAVAEELRAVRTTLECQQAKET